MNAYAQMADGTFYGMSEEQEQAARKSGLHTNQQDSGNWGWSAEFGEEWDFETELEAWAAGLQALEDD